MYGNIPREELIKLLMQRDDQIASMKASHQNVQMRLDQLEEAVSSVVTRMKEADNAETLVQQLVREQEERFATCDASLNEKIQLLLKVANQCELEVQNSPFCFLGLQVEQQHSGAVCCSAVASPALESGIFIGDELLCVTCSKMYQITTLEDYQFCACELAPGSHVDVLVRRNDRTFRCTMSPKVSFGA